MIRGVVTTFDDPNASYGIGRIFPKDWTDEQVIAWNNQHCDCPFHKGQREQENHDAA